MKNKLFFLVAVFLLTLFKGNAYAIAQSPIDNCKANFSYSIISGAPLSVQFWDASSATYITYLWEFGDNTTSNEQNPLHEYQQAGVYEVCLYISDVTKSCFDVLCKTIIVPIPTDCGASFIYTRDASNLLQYHFISTTGIAIDSLWWDFGDGNSSTVPNPSHTYADTGIYIVTLNAKNIIASEVCWSLFIDTIDCSIEECVSKFEAIAHPINPFIYNFNAVTQGSINSYYWDFGDGRNSTEPNPIHTFVDTGTFIVKLKVGNIFFPEYCSDSSEQSIFIELMPCQSLFSFLQDSTNPMFFNFLNQSSGPGDEWVWTFGDGNSSSEINPIHLYSDTGNYEVCLTIRNSQYPNYCNDVNCIPISIADLTCSSAFTYSQDTNDLLSVTFNPLNPGPANNHEWTFGDDYASSEIRPVHQYADTGWYEIKHHVSNTYFPQYCNSTIMDSIYIGFVKYPEANFDILFDSLSGTPNLYSFTDRSTGTRITNWNWSFGDGAGSTQQNPVHHYMLTSSFIVCLEVSDSIPPRYQLKSQRCKTIQTHQYYDLGGSIYDGPIPINNPDPEGDTAEVTLYRIYNENNIVAVASRSFSSLGYYYFQNVLKGNYMVRANITDGSRQAGKFYPTWAKEAVNWTQANPIELNQSLFLQHVYLQPLPDIPTGVCGIDGIVLRVPDPNTTTGISESGVTVYLADPARRILKYNVTDITGRFLFRNLPVGSYLLFADHPGFLSSTESVALTNQMPFGGNIRVKIYKQPEVGINEAALTDDLLVAGNPFGRFLNICLSEMTTGTSTITIRNMIGQTIFELNTDEKSLTINTEKWPSGIYLIHLDNPSIHSQSRKVLKF
ncbi:MAG TPA: hypothetical protein DEO70_07480 [Bacteroidales bacterium]|nr:MAG: hypothetical protein A2X11_07100 [Bacteroidetes bacterium GWE2_42_24]OFY25929.1 MAG: hypothetical protein A2X09_04495 [Bacteroidetes bacterium GWF2_43_11]HBZ66663.1 hypothetical protein [Bacteroidales bacterium]